MASVNLGVISEDEKSQFASAIEELVWQHDISYIEAITHYCEDFGVEVNVAALLVSDQLKSKIESEAISLRYLPRTSSLPI